MMTISADNNNVVTIGGNSYNFDEIKQLYNLPEDAIVSGCDAIASNSADKLTVLRHRHWFNAFSFDGFAGKSMALLDDIDELWENRARLFDSTLLTESKLMSVGFGPNQSKNFITEIHRKKSKGIKLATIIYALGINGAGSRICNEFAKYLSGVDYSFASLTKSVIDELKDLEHTILELVQTLKSFDVTIIYPKPPVESRIDQSSIVKYVLTGSPKNFGFKTKAEFKQQLPEFWIETSKMNEASYLICDDLESKSSKMKNAQKLNVQAITYEQAINIAKSQV